ncbi:MAG TPA: SCO family protein [Blastocatellia bacterium]|nr:SCO family protein [Blastocatellia bacterium]
MKARQFPGRLICSAIVAMALLLSAGHADASFPAPQTTQYVCPMHPDVRSKSPAKCPKCGMDLRESADAPAPPAPAAAIATKKDGSLEGLRIPDTPVYDQDGRKLRFNTDLVKGKTVAINFIFTTCTTICPPLAATFARVQKDLGDRVGRDVVLISVSVDPAIDVPERMKSFLAKFGARPGWTFVSGNKPEIDELLRQLGAYVSDKNDHTPMILIGNEPADYWTRAYGLAPAGKLVKLIEEAAAKPAAAGVQNQ